MSVWAEGAGGGVPPGTRASAAPGAPGGIASGAPGGATPFASAVALDHVGVAARDLPPLLAQYQRLGFDLSPLAQQSGRRTPEGPVELFGSGNRCAFFRHGYVELIGILDPALYPNAVDQFVARYHGLHIAAFAMANAEANLARLRAGGLAIPGVAYLERPVEAGGSIARFARLPFPDAPEGRVQLISHLTPELVWQDRWMNHANKVDALEALVLVAADPAKTAARFSRLTGLPVLPDPAGGFLLELPGMAGAAGPNAPVLRTSVRMLPPEALPRVLPGVVPPCLPFMAGMVLRTSDGNAAVRTVLAALPVGDMPVQEMPGGALLVPPGLAGGAAILFAP